MIGLAISPSPRFSTVPLAAGGFPSKEPEAPPDVIAVLLRYVLAILPPHPPIWECAAGCTVFAGDFLRQRYDIAVLEARRFVARSFVLFEAGHLAAAVLRFRNDFGGTQGRVDHLNRAVAEFEGCSRPHWIPGPRAIRAFGRCRLGHRPLRICSGAASVHNVTSFGVVGRLWTLRRLPECHCRSALPRFARRAMLFGLSH
jgi:hypothetical protein